MEMLKIFAPFLAGCFLLGLSCVLQTISRKTKVIGTTAYFEQLPTAEKFGKTLKVISCILMVITAAFGVYYMVNHDFRELISVSIFIFFGLYYIGVNLGGHTSSWLINTFTKFTADTSLADNMTSC